MQEEALFEEIRQVLKISRSEPASFMALVSCICELEQEGDCPSSKKVVKRLWPDEWNAAKNKIAFEASKWGLLRKRRNRINRRILDSHLCLSFYIELTPEKSFRIVRDPGEIRRLRIEELEGALAKSQSDAERERITRAITRFKYAVSPSFLEKSKPQRRRWPYAAGTLLLLMLLVVFLVSYRRPVAETTSFLPPSSVSKISLVLSPFKYASDDPVLASFAEGMNKKLIASFSVFPDFNVTTPSSGSGYGARSLKARRDGTRDSYLLEGSVRVIEDEVHVDACLRNKEGAREVFWVGNWQCRMEKMVEMREEVTLDILSSVHVRMEAGERAHVFARGTRTVEAYIKLMNAYAHFFKGAPSDGLSGTFMARQLCEEAIALDSDYAAAYALLSDTYAVESQYTQHSDLLTKALAIIHRALVLDDKDPFAHWVYARINWIRGEREKALTEAQRAISLSPDFVDIINGYATMLAYTDHLDEAKELFEYSLKLPPHEGQQPYGANMTLGTIYLKWGKYEKASAYFERAFQLFPEKYPCSVYLAASYIALGRKMDARETVQRVLKLVPEFTVDDFILSRRNNTQLPPLNYEIFAELLHLAGLP